MPVSLSTCNVNDKEDSAGEVGSRHHRAKHTPGPGVRGAEGVQGKVEKLQARLLAHANE